MVIITIIIGNFKRGRKNEIKVDTKDTIKDLKIKSGLVNFDFLFDGFVLEDNKRIEDYEIKNGDIIRVLSPPKGGEVGSSIKGFTDPKKIGPIRYSIITDGPDYLTVKDGINLFGNCKNRNCIAYNKEVCCPFGFGTFDLIKDLVPENEKCPKCPACELPLLKLETCGFMKCRFKYVGIKVEDGKNVDVNYENSISEPDKLDYFDAGKDWGNKSLWMELKISAYSL